MASANEVADWMVSEVEVEGFLYEERAITYIADKFGEDFVYTNENGTPAISEAVLTVFRELTDGAVIWDRWDKCWRQRQRDGLAGR
jgi:hypothetical protein